MQTRFAPPWRLSLALILSGFCGVSGAQEEDQFLGFPEALACPAPLEPVADGQAASGSADGATQAQPFDYSLLQKKRQQLAAQQRLSAAIDARSPLEFGDTVPRFGPLTGREKKLLARAAAADAARFADAVTSFREEESSVEEYYRSVPEEPQPEAPEQPMIALPPLSTALSRHGQVPLQLQNAKATTGLSTGAGPLIAATAADPHPARGHDPGNAKAIMAASGGV